MDAHTLERMINDPAVTDSAVFDATREFAADKFDASGGVIPPSDKEQVDIERLGNLTQQKRPAVMAKLKKLTQQCCGDCNKDRG
jgi:hypothetical protein